MSIEVKRDVRSGQANLIMSSFAADLLLSAAAAHYSATVQEMGGSSAYYESRAEEINAVLAELHGVFENEVGA